MKLTKQYTKIVARRKIKAQEVIEKMEALGFVFVDSDNRHDSYYYLFDWKGEGEIPIEQVREIVRGDPVWWSNQNPRSKISPLRHYGDLYSLEENTLEDYSHG